MLIAHVFQTDDVNLSIRCPYHRPPPQIPSFLFFFFYTKVENEFMS